MGRKIIKSGDPPRWAIKLFRWFCNDQLCDAVLGDLLELYDRRRASMGKFKADLLFVWNVIQFIQPFAIRKKSPSQDVNTFGMIKNYFTVARRNMAKNKMHTTITIGGFALGLATCMMIFLFIKTELGYDKHYKEGSRVFRIYNNFEGPDGSKWTNTQPPLAGVFRDELMDIELVGRLMANGMGDSKNGLIRRDDELENTFQERVAYIDPEILEMLETPMVFGDNKKALKDPQTIVISRTKSIQYFGDVNPIGKILILNNKTDRPYTVSGVMEDSNPQSHFQYDFLLTLSGREFWPGEQTNWCCWNYDTYVKLREGVNPLDFEKKLIPIRDNHLLTYMETTGSKDLENMRKNHSYKLQPVADIWLQHDIGDNYSHGSMTYVWTFGGIAVFILLLACINFINLSTARSANRAKEVGLRKVVGSKRKYLVAQFLTESVIYSVISFAIALGLAVVTLPTFSYFSNRTLAMPWGDWWFFPLLITAALLIGFVAGLYPSIYLSAFKPIDVLKGRIARGSRSSGLRSAMVVFQFTTSIMLIIGTLVVYGHMNFLLSRDVGFNKDQVMILEGTASIPETTRETLREELLKLPSVENVSVSGYLPVDGSNREGYGFYLEGREKLDPSIGAQKWRVDFSYISTMGMKIVEGRDFIRNLKSDSASVIINQEMARELGLQNPVGQRITNGTVYTIIGVVADFNFSDMRNRVRPLCMVIERWGEGAMSIRVNTSDMSATIQSVSELWQRMMPNQPIRFSFLDDRFARMYDDVLRMGRLFALFATLAIVVACLGLFALSSFMIEQRAKEISVRRVLGASVQSIFGLLTGNFMKLLLISWVIATPLGWYGMNKWLEDFEFKEPIANNIFLISGLIVGVIAIVTVSYQTISAALDNPVNNLRNE